MRGEDDQGPFGHVLLAVDENRPSRFEIADDMDVVDDLVADVDRRTVGLEQALDDLDGTIDAGAERSRRREQHLPTHAAASSRFRRARRTPASERHV